jgi:diacylglycerol kinase (ATP)
LRRRETPPVSEDPDSGEFGYSQRYVRLFGGGPYNGKDIIPRQDVRMPPAGPICVIFNPAAGRGMARKLVHSIRKEMDVELDLRPTHHCGHAVELARAAACDGYPVVAAAGGDGTVHEVANGILRADRRETVFSIWPIGSANDYAFALGIKPWWRKRYPPPADVRTVDVGRVEGGSKSAFYVNCLGVGFNGAVVLESRNIGWLRGATSGGFAVCLFTD